MRAAAAVLRALAVSQPDQKEAHSREGWRYEIQYGPEGEANYAWLYEGERMVATMRTEDAIRICNALAARQPAPVADTEQAVAWRPVAGYEECYEVSSFGDLRSVRSGKIAAKNLMGSGYVKADLWKDGKRRQTSVHRLVAEAFIDRPDGMTEVNHIDGDKTNNATSNLEWTNRRGNTHHSRYVLGNDVKPVLSVDPESGVETYYPSIEEAGRQGFSASGIYDALNGRKKTHGGKLWSFTDWRTPSTTHPAPLDAERVREAWAYRVHDFHIARSPVKARAKFPESTEHLYPANRHADAIEMARLLGGTCTPLYPPEDAR